MYFEVWFHHFCHLWVPFVVAFTGVPVSVLFLESSCFVENIFGQIEMHLIYTATSASVASSIVATIEYNSYASDTVSIATTCHFELHGVGDQVQVCPTRNTISETHEV